MSTDELDGNGNPIYDKIRVSMKGWLKGHQRHGDVLPGEEGLDENCELTTGPVDPEDFRLLYMFASDPGGVSHLDTAESFTFGPEGVSIDHDRDVGPGPWEESFLESRMDVPAAEGLDLDTQDFTATVSFENFDIAPPGAEVQFDLTWIDGTDFRKVAIEMVKCCVGDPEGGILRTWSILAAPGLDSDTLVPSGTFVVEKTGSDVTLSMEGVGGWTYTGVSGQVDLLTFALITLGSGLVQGHVDVTNYEFTLTDP